MATFNPTEEGLGFDLASLVKLQKMLTPEVEKFRSLRSDYRETCKPEEKPEVSLVAQQQAEFAVIGVVARLREFMLECPEVALILADELSSLATDVKQVGKDFLMSTGQEVSDGEGDEEKLQKFLDQRERVSGIYKVWEGLKDYILSTVSIEEAKKAGLQVKKNTKANAKTEYITENPNDPSKSADDSGIAKAGRPAAVNTFTYNYSINGEKLPNETPRFLALLQASEGAESIYTWQDLHNAIKLAKQEIGGEKFEVKFSNGVIFSGVRVKK